MTKPLTRPMEPTPSTDRTVAGKIIPSLPKKIALWEKIVGPVITLGVLLFLGYHLSEPLVSLGKVSMIIFPASVLVMVVLLGYKIRVLIDQRERTLKNSKLLEELKAEVSLPAGDKATDLVLRRLEFRSEDSYIFPTADDQDGLLTTAVQLNCATFSSTPFASSFDEKFYRNQTHQKKNPYSIMLIKLRQITESFLDKRQAETHPAFTHLIPISRETYNRYVKGNISDTDLYSDLVCSLEDKAYAIIIFSLGMDRWMLKQILRNQRLNRADQVLSKLGIPAFRTGDLRKMERKLWEGFVYHLHQLLKNQNRNEDVILVAQCLNKKVVKVLTAVGFEDMGRTSADGDLLFKLRVRLE